MSFHRLIHGDDLVHIEDITADAVYQSGNPGRRRFAELVGARTAVWVALRKDEALLGALVICRQEVRPFSDKQIVLLQNFAAQAVIAMENARLLTETREALQQQTATAEVLQVINSSPGWLAPVFDAMLDKATKLCAASFGVLWTIEGPHIRAAASHGVPAAYKNFLERELSSPGPESAVAQTVRQRIPLHFNDAAQGDAYRNGDRFAIAAVELGGVRTLLNAPLLKGVDVLGILAVYRQEVRPFSEKQIALLQNFAAQAVIAMENARLLTETREALEQQTATAEVLQVINSSPGDLAPVFDAMLEKATSLCEAAFGILWRFDGEFVRPSALYRVPPAFAEFWREPRRPGPETGPARIMRGEDTLALSDLAEYSSYRDGDPMARAIVDLAGARSVVIAPLRKDGVTLGAITVYRQEVRPFTDKQIALLQNFATQAVIAMENARLITETREALEQQTATADVLQVINSSPGNLAPVFDAMLEKAMSLCEASFGGFFIAEGERIRAVATRGTSPRLTDFVRQGFAPGPLSVAMRGEVLHVRDLAAEDLTGKPGPAAAMKLGGARTLLNIPLLKERAVVGVFSVYRKEVRPFTDKQIALLQNFAAQAVIAMENARLITETREALEQQTATAEVLGVINSSPGDLMPVFDAMLEKAMRLCSATVGMMWSFEGNSARLGASRNVPQAFSEYLDRNPPSTGPETFFGRAIAARNVIHTADMMAAEPYLQGVPLARAGVELAGIRALLMAPLVKDGAVPGVFAVFRSEPRPFTDKQIALLQNFAAQAVIAMENARLLTETREALEQQTATAEVLQVINSSPGDLAPVFEVILEKALRLSGAGFGNLLSYDGELFHIEAAVHRDGHIANEQRQRPPFRAAPGGTLVPMLEGQGVSFFENILEMPDYKAGHAEFRRMIDSGGYRTVRNVALRKEGALLGTIGIFDTEIRPFTDKQIALLQNFAAQAVIAMENARLLGELRQRTDQIAEINRDLEARVAAQVTELERTGKLRRFLAPQLAELIVARGDESILETHRREIVVAFCDLRGFTAFAERAEPEEVISLLREYHGALGPIVARYEGTLDHYSGDGIMVFFNDPMPCPEPAKRAVEMAVAMRQAAQELLRRWRRHGHDIGFGVGIAQGYATLGQIGFAERMDYTAIGTVCNLAARLCAEAKDGQILVSSRVAAAVEDGAGLEQVADVSLKGLSQPVVVYNVA